ncbi:MAG: hypothetical protein KF727_03640 [Microbacteriaceae bacterium]|nr:hypothetical protein [Microbacteriaceae bacterium]
MSLTEVDTPDGLMVEGAGPELLAELLVELEREMAAAGAPSEMLAPGISPERCRELLLPICGHVPAEVEVWFEWHNGVLGGADAPRLLRGLEYWSAEQVARADPHLGLPPGKEEWEWDRRWLRLTGDNYGLIVTTDLRSHPLVRRWNPELGTAPLSAPSPLQVVSLCTPVARWIGAIRNRWWTWNPGLRTWDYDSAGPPAFFR